MTSFGRKRFALGIRDAGTGLASFRSALTAFIVALALVAQLIAMPLQALAEPQPAGPSAAAADLKAIFGDAVGFCAHADDKGVPVPHGPCNHCDDQCPLCRSVVQSAAFIPPDAPALPARLNGACRAIGSAPEFGVLSARPVQRNRARAPPLEL